MPTDITFCHTKIYAKVKCLNVGTTYTCIRSKDKQLVWLRIILMSSPTSSLVLWLTMSEEVCPTTLWIHSYPLHPNYQYNQLHLPSFHYHNNLDVHKSPALLARHNSKVTAAIIYVSELPGQSCILKRRNTDRCVYYLMTVSTVKIIWHQW
jgi:hypothetical protein